MPIVKKDDDREAVLAAADSLHKAAADAGLRVHLDADEGRTPGWKYNFYEMKVRQQSLILIRIKLCCRCRGCTPSTVIYGPGIAGRTWQSHASTFAFSNSVF